MGATDLEELPVVRAAHERALPFEGDRQRQAMNAAKAPLGSASLQVPRRLAVGLELQIGYVQARSFTTRGTRSKVKRTLRHRNQFGHRDSTKRRHRSPDRFRSVGRGVKSVWIQDGGSQDLIEERSVYGLTL